MFEDLPGRKKKPVKFNNLNFTGLVEDTGQMLNHLLEDFKLLASLKGLQSQGMGLVIHIPKLVIPIERSAHNHSFN